MIQKETIEIDTVICDMCGKSLGTRWEGLAIRDPLFVEGKFDCCFKCHEKIIQDAKEAAVKKYGQHLTSPKK